MNDKFFELKREKQDRMINAALLIFSKSPYKHASTDDIVKEAGISKGLLFHYFGSKEGIYSFIYDYSIRFVGLELYSSVSIKEDDYFELLMQIERAHHHVMKKYPSMIAFLKTTEKEPKKELREMTDEKSGMLRESYEIIYNRANMKRLEGLQDIDRMIKIIQYTLAGLEREYEETLDCTIDDLYEEKISYLRLIKNIYL